MKSNSFESKIKTAMHNRSIQPKDNSWDRLDAMLTVAEKQPAKKSFRWFYVAASFIGLFLVVTVFWKSNNQMNEPINSVVIENNTPEIPTETNNNKAIEIQQDVLNQSSKQLAKTHIKPAIKKSVFEDQLENTYTEKNVEIAQLVSSLNKNTIIKPVTETEVNLLLAEAQSSVNQEKATSVKIDALQLLNQVDEPVLLTFKDKALHALTENYKTIQTAVSNRNH